MMGGPYFRNETYIIISDRRHCRLMMGGPYLRNETYIIISDDTADL
jgi:hypothetical protein